MDAYSEQFQGASDTAGTKGDGLDNLVTTTGSAAVETGLAVYDDRLATFLRISQQRREQLVWMAQRMTRNREDAEDIVQESLLRAFKNLPNFRGESQMGTWLCVIVQNVGRECLRRRKGKIYLSLERTRNEGDDSCEYDFPDPGQNPEQACENRELEKILLSEIEKMNSACKSVLQMCALEELSQQNVAIALGIKVSAIKSRFFRSRWLLKRAIRLRIGVRRRLSRA